jgi:hypothetical protein
MHHGASAQCLFNEWFGLNVEWSEFRDYTQLHSYQMLSAANEVLSAADEPLSVADETLCAVNETLPAPNEVRFAPNKIVSGTTKILCANDGAMTLHQEKSNALNRSFSTVTGQSRYSKKKSGKAGRLFRSPFHS